MSEVLVIGGGPAGAATALLLARQGVQVTVLDKARFPRDKPCAEYMSPGVRQALSRLGILEAVDRVGGMLLRGFCLYTSTDAIQADFHPGAAGFAVPRLKLDETLIQHAIASGATLYDGVRAVDVERTDTTIRVWAFTQQGRRLAFDARLLIAADGVNSSIAHRLGVRRRVPGLTRIGLVTHMEGIAGLSEYGEMHLGDGWYCGLAPFDHRVANVAMVVERSCSAAFHGDLTGHFLRLLRSLPSLKGRLDSAQIIKPVAAVGPLAVHARPPWGPGVLFVGDAAGFFDPLTGQGVYRALRCAELAAAAVREGLAATDPGHALLRYVVARQREFSASWRVEQLVQAVLMRPALRRHVFARLSRRKFMADTLIGVTGDIIPARHVLNPRYLLRLLI